MKKHVRDTDQTSRDLIKAIGYAERRLRDALMYGPNMRSSTDLCIQDAISILAAAVILATKEEE